MPLPLFFFFNDTATTEIYTLSLHDALPISNLRAMILLDASRSMAWRGAPNRLTKRAYADRLAAALALILLRQRDATGLITFDEVVREVVPARVKAGQWARMVRGLVDTPEGLGTSAQAALVSIPTLL